MGNQDNWTTPKQLKIERAGEPKGTRRGPLKKGERKKGKKARIDEILSVIRDCQKYIGYIEEDLKSRKAHPEWYRPFEGPGIRYDPEYRKWHSKSLKKLQALLDQAVRDGVIQASEATHYEETAHVRFH